MGILAPLPPRSLRSARRQSLDYSAAKNTRSENANGTSGGGSIKVDLATYDVGAKPASRSWCAA